MRAESFERKNVEDKNVRLIRNSMRWGHSSENFGDSGSEPRPRPEAVISDRDREQVTRALRAR